MTRLFNPNTGEHLYTSDGNEARTLIAAGWNDEGDAWTSPAEDAPGVKPVHRLRNPNTDDHHLAVDGNEIRSLEALGWVDEGVPFYSAASGVPVYTEFNPNVSFGAHNYTPDHREHASLLSIGWQGVESPAFYGVA